MYYLNVWLKVRESEHIAGVVDALRRTGTASRLEQGCERWEAYHSQAEPRCFLLVEQWTTKEDWERHRTGAAVTEIYFKEVIPFVEREPHPSQLVI